MPMSAIFVSDVHLTDATSVKAQLMLRFFQEHATKFERVYILGDLFDVWPGTNRYLVRQFRPLLDVFKSMVKKGHLLTYIEGNHDFRLGAFFTEEIGFRVFANELVEDFSGRKVYMAHGDLGNPHDKKYPVLRRFLRQDLLHRAISPIPPQILYSIASGVSRLSRSVQRKVPPNEELVRSTYRETAHRKFLEGHDVVIMGHTHIPDYFEASVDGRTCQYFNLGDWVKSFTYLEFEGAEFYTKTHPVKNL
jgi:UDP-2,3-diacylglucosamine hydrolase